MDDKKYFLEYKKSFEMIFSSSRDNCAYITDLNFKYQLVTPKMIEILGLNSAEDILNKNINEIAKNINANNLKVIKGFTKQFTEQDLRSLLLKKHKTYVEFMTVNEEVKIYLQQKIPIINPETENCVGIRGHIMNLLWPHAVKVLLRMHGTKGLLLNHKNGNKNPLKEFPLNNMQHMVLFLSLSNYSYSEIALLLNEFGYAVTATRVNDYLEQLKLIFHVRNKTQLIEKALGLNFNLLLPRGLFNKLGSIEITEENARIIESDPTME